MAELKVSNADTHLRLKYRLQWDEKALLYSGRKDRHEWLHFSQEFLVKLKGNQKLPLLASWLKNSLLINYKDAKESLWNPQAHCDRRDPQKE